VEMRRRGRSDRRMGRSLPVVGGDAEWLDPLSVNLMDGHAAPTARS
jgi:hypothetical protein